MDRRRFLAATATALATSSVAGCTGGQSSPDDGASSSQTTPESTPTETPTQSSPTPTAETTTPTETPVPFPESCQPVPDIDGLPSLPAELTEDSAVSFATEFERVYVVASDPDTKAIDRLSVTHVESIGDRYNVQLAVETRPATPTPGPDGNTPTPMPADANAHRARYRLVGNKMIRELLGYPAGRRMSRDCWTVPRET